MSVLILKSYRLVCDFCPKQNYLEMSMEKVEQTVAKLKWRVCTGVTEDAPLHMCPNCQLAEDRRLAKEEELRAKRRGKK